MDTVTDNVTEGKSRNGVTVGLVDAIISISSVLRERLKQDIENADTHSDEFYNSGTRYGYATEVESALEDLQQHEPLYLLLQQIGYNPKIITEDHLKMLNQIERTENAIIKFQSDKIKELETELENRNKP